MMRLLFHNVQVYKTGFSLQSWSFVESFTAGAIANIVIIVLALRRNPTFIRWRSPCMIAIRLLRGAIIFVTQSDIYSSDIVHSVAMPSSQVGVVWHLLKMVSFGWRGRRAAHCVGCRGWE